MSDQKKPEALKDDDLDAAQGGGIFQTPAGGWGKKLRKGKGIFEDTNGAENFTTHAGGDPNV
ncbi:MAG: hypothetical protein AAGC81_17115 [Pseudomonadota bacterium]